MLPTPPLFFSDYFFAGSKTVESLHQDLTCFIDSAFFLVVASIDSGFRKLQWLGIVWRVIKYIMSDCQSLFYDLLVVSWSS